MIGSYLIFVVLFVAASLSWGLVFSFDAVKLAKKNLFLFLVCSVIISTLASVFLLEGLAETMLRISFTFASATFALTFCASLGVGYALSAVPKTSAFILSIEKMFAPSGKDGDRSEIIEQILERSAKSGEINILERELLESVLKFNDKIVREVMVPRGDIVAINIDEDPRPLLRKVIEEGFSRLPVYRGSVDNVVGVIYAKDLLTMVEDGGVIVLQDIVRSPYYVPESKKISQLLRDMQKNKVHLAVVVDEFGGTEGIVTLEDVLEEIVGEIQDEYDESLSEIVKDENGDIHFSGSMTVSRFNELLGCEVPQGEDYDTMAGFVQKLAGRLPQEGEVFNHDEMLFHVEELFKHRIRRLKVSYREHPFQVNDRIKKGVSAEAPYPGAAVRTKNSEAVTIKKTEHPRKKVPTVGRKAIRPPQSKKGKKRH